MTALSVNINKVATLRNARGGNVPDLLQVAEDLQQYGAQGITIHPRPDERHIRYEDARQLPQVLTTEFNIEGNPIPEFKAAGIRTSIFVDPAIEMVEGAKEVGTDRIELYTEAYAKNYQQSPEKAIKPYILAAEKAVELNLGINAGHDLSLENIQYFAQHIPQLLEVSIGHALICESLYLGFENVIPMYLQRLKF